MRAPGPSQTAADGRQSGESVTRVKHFLQTNGDAITLTRLPKVGTHQEKDSPLGEELDVGEVPDEAELVEHDAGAEEAENLRQHLGGASCKHGASNKGRRRRRGGRGRDTSLGWP